MGLRPLFFARMNHFVSDRGDHLITHDGHIQLGVFIHSLEDHYRLNPSVKWEETYWVPDCFGRRYKRANYQATMRKHG